MKTSWRNTRSWTGVPLGLGLFVSVKASQVHLARLQLVMAGILVLSASANSDDYTKKSCSPACRWPQECNYEAGVCECRNTACNRVVLNDLSWTCADDVDCAQVAAFSYCFHDTCLCLPGYMATAKDKCEFSSVNVEETTTLRSWRPPPTPHGPGPADYSGVVKLALGAAIVMLAGVILALVWNLYRERRRAAQGLSRPPTNRRRRQQAQRNSGLPHSHDLPPSYNDIFIISGAEAGRRHEKPPSYEEAMQDQQFAVVAPLAFVNYGFTGEGGPLGTRRPPPVRVHAEASGGGVASALVPNPEPAQVRGWQPSLNVASIMNRLGSATTRLPRSVSDCGPGRSTAVPSIVLTECENVDNSDAHPPTNYDGLNVRRTKSGRAPHRRSTSDLTRTESMGSVADSCCSTSEVAIVGVQSDSSSVKSHGEYMLTGTAVLPSNSSADVTHLADAHAISVDKGHPSLKDDQSNSVTSNSAEFVVDLTQSSSTTVELGRATAQVIAPEESDTISTKVPGDSKASATESGPTIFLPMAEEDAHSNADVSFC